VARFTHTATDGTSSQREGGEAIGFALRVGTHVGSTWGVEAEFARPSEIENAGRPEILPLAYSDLPADLIAQLVTGSVGTAASSLPVVYPIPYDILTSERNTTFSTTAWVRQGLSRRSALVYLGGVGVHRIETRTEYTFGPIRGPISFSLPSKTRTRTVTYSVRPVVGIEWRMGMTDQLELVVGTRLHGLEGGVLIRPSVGLGWIF